MSQADIEKLLERKEKVNFKIALIERENKKKEEEIAELLSELNALGVKATKDNVQELLVKFSAEYQEQVAALEREVEQAEMVLKGDLD